MIREIIIKKDIIIIEVKKEHESTKFSIYLAQQDKAPAHVEYRLKVSCLKQKMESYLYIINLFSFDKKELMVILLNIQK